MPDTKQELVERKNAKEKPVILPLSTLLLLPSLIVVYPHIWKPTPHQSYAGSTFHHPNEKRFFRAFQTAEGSHLCKKFTAPNNDEYILTRADKVYTWVDFIFLYNVRDMLTVQKTEFAELHSPGHRLNDPFFYKLEVDEKDNSLCHLERCKSPQTNLPFMFFSGSAAARANTMKNLLTEVGVLSMVRGLNPKMNLDRATFSP